MLNLLSVALVAPALLTGVAALPQPSATLAAPLAKRTDHSGVATYYNQNGAAGSCGNYNPDSAYIAALSPYWMNQGTYCGRTIQVTNNGGGQSNNGKGKTITVKVADTCPGCDENHLGE
ncbi:MAG: hypothetical protein Q9162_004731 [Coniocarpon cinnabarinum]